MAGGWFDNLRRMLGWWSAAPSSVLTPTDWIGVDTATLRLSRCTAINRPPGCTATLQRCTITATHRLAQATARIDTTNATATQRPV